MNRSVHRPLATVLRIPVDALCMESALERVRGLLELPGRNFVCCAAVHGIVEAQRNPALREAYDRAVMTIPDGMPLVWVGQHQGHHAMERVTGPDLMLEIFRRPEFSGMKHFLYGGEPGVADDLRRRFTARFPQAHIVGTFVPPFRELNAAEDQELEAAIESAKPDIIWVGLGCPKQEIFMSRYVPIVNARLMIGVGAAFNYHTGKLRDCAPWIKRAGLQWLHRLLQEPGRLWRRYLITNSTFIALILLQALGISVAKKPAKPRAGARTSGADARP
jgi:N-acetylglucosaminyldiphosphoundecaprenol N-acetyl-beta-D-mannosaminyltransferase